MFIFIFLGYNELQIDFFRIDQRWFQALKLYSLVDSQSTGCFSWINFIRNGFVWIIQQSIQSNEKYYFEQRMNFD